MCNVNLFKKHAFLNLYTISYDFTNKNNTKLLWQLAINWIKIIFKNYKAKINQTINFKITHLADYSLFYRWLALIKLIYDKLMSRYFLKQ